MGNTPSEDHVAAFKLLERLKAETSIDGHGTHKNAHFAERVVSILAAVQPTASVIAIAGWKAPSDPNNVWEHAIIAVLEDAFRLRLNEDLMHNQRVLADSNDALGRKMFWVTIAGVAVAAVGVAPAIPFVVDLLGKLVGMFR